MVLQQANEIDEIFKGLKQKPGFKAFMVLNHDGVVLRWDHNKSGKLPYDKAVHYSHHVLELYEMIVVQIKDLFNPEDDEVESIRLRTNGHELIAAKEGRYILVVLCDCFTYSKEEKDMMAALEVQT